MAPANAPAVDLRSDTVTRPTPGMREAMARAEVGDDVFGEDPTVNRLQATAAALLDKEAALFVSSGTQANLLAVLSHCQRGEEYIAGDHAHAYWYEAGGAAVLGSVQPQPVPMAADGTVPLDRVRAVVKPDDFHVARTRLLCIENTCNGKPLPRDYLIDAGTLCRELGLALHMDGARLFNAAIAQNIDAKALAEPCDSVSVCLSKGLGAPVGSLLLGSVEFIARARLRKMLGGGMRQAGIPAAAGLYALEKHIARLVVDHVRAERIAAVLSERFPGKIRQHTNMIFLGLPDGQLKPFLAHMNTHGILVSRPRWVVHLDVDDAAEARTIDAIRAY
ncbi:MAG: low-specificity L-threonine aldolase [Pseudomonadales bacterium]